MKLINVSMIPAPDRGKDSVLIYGLYALPTGKQKYFSVISETSSVIKTPEFWVNVEQMIAEAEKSQ